MLFFKYLFIFALFSIVGWILELFYRSFTTKKFVNPGFMSGCVVPLYGFGAIILNFICMYVSKLNFNYKIILVFIFSMLLLSFLEFICGFIMLKYFHIRLWDYKEYKINYKGFVCLNFSLLWALLGVFYYIWIHPYINNISLNFINSNAGIYFLGIFSGIFLIDLSVSIKLLNRLTKYANELKENLNIEKIKLEARINANRRKMFNTIYPYISTNKYLKDKIKELRK